MSVIISLICQLKVLLLKVNERQVFNVLKPGVCMLKPDSIFSSGNVISTPFSVSGCSKLLSII